MAKISYADSLDTWSKDRYVVSKIQRNILFFVTIITSISLMVSLVMLQNLYRQKKIEPYVMEYNKKTGQVEVVKQQTKQNYTQNRIVRESLIVNYIKNRESVNPANVDEQINFVRLTSSQRVYGEFAINIKKDIAAMRGAGINPHYVIKMKSIKFLSGRNAEILFTKQLISDTTEEKEKTYFTTIGFQFATLDISLEERYINPLEFQVVFYSKGEKTVISQEDEKKDEIDSKTKDD